MGRIYIQFFCQCFKTYECIYQIKITRKYHMQSIKQLKENTGIDTTIKTEQINTISTSQDISLPQKKNNRYEKRVTCGIVFLFFVIGSLYQKSLHIQSTDPYQQVNLMPFNGHGWFSSELQIQKLIKQNNIATIIEVGSWMGKSTRFMASLIPQNGKVYAVDTWMGQPTKFFQYDPQTLVTLYDQFLSNVIHTNLTHKIVPIRMTSEQAARKLNVFPHLIYIDATHNFQEAAKDLRLWYPFVQGHGVICGGDFTWGDGGVGRAVVQFAKLKQLQYYTDGTFWKLFASEHLKLPQKTQSIQSTDPYQHVTLMPYNDHGWFPNARQIQKLIKQSNIATIIEVGSWMGKSTRFMASLIPQNGKVYAVDTWMGQPTKFFQYDPQTLVTLYDQFLSNVIHTNLTHKIVPIRMTSEQAARKLNVFPHLIYIDATHNFQEAAKDLRLWYPFVQGHGVICGGDFTWGDGGVGRAVVQFAKLKQLQYYTDGTFWKLFNF